jgi:catechol 2,3-dioxygenase-like lactoylglutathione lyase family enzyme
MGFAATKHPELAKAFYRDTLGLRLIEDSAFAIIFDANGTMLRIQKVQELIPAKHTALGWRVDDIRSTIDELSPEAFDLNATTTLRRTIAAFGAVQMGLRSLGSRTRMETHCP